VGAIAAVRNDRPGKHSGAATREFGPPEGITFLSNEDGLPEAGSDAEYLENCGVPHDLECGVIPVAYSRKERSYAKGAGTAAARTPSGGFGRGKILSVRGVPHIGAAVAYPFDDPVHGECTAAIAAERLAADRRKAEAKTVANGGSVSAYTEKVPAQHVLVVSFPMSGALKKFRNPGAFVAFFASLFPGEKTTKKKTTRKQRKAGERTPWR